MLKGAIPETATGVVLYRIRGERLIGCETCDFEQGSAGVELVMRRAAISGRVEVGGKLENHFADLLDKDGSMVETVALDAKSYGALKNRWMRCRVETAS
jgi:hypothetical protein